MLQKIIMYIEYIFIMLSFIQPFNLNKKSNLRKLGWEEDVKLYTDNLDDEEKDSIDHCQTGYYTDYKYNIFYEVGKEKYVFKSNLVEDNDYHAVSNIFKR